jgi:glycosyltransferase involved in cell wall biosynthesis
VRILTLFMSAGKSLGWWKAQGILSREILVYRELLAAGAFDRVQVFSYDAADRALLAELAAGDPLYERFEALAPATGTSGKLWGVAGVLRHRAAIARSSVLKTNQISGAWAAVFASRVTGVPLVLRAGYIQSRNLKLAGSPAKGWAAWVVERAASQRARAVIVTSEAAADHFRRDATVASKVHLLPTYVDLNAFAAKRDYDWDAPVIAVGRMSAPKNLPALLKGCALAGVGLTLVGKGEKEAELRALAATLPVPIRFTGTVENAVLAGLLAEHTIFALPSLYEGLPKALIEAMSTGLVCIGSNIPGITDLIEDGVTGYLTEGVAAEDIAAAIRRARAARNPAIGAQARAKVEARYGLDRYVASEAAIFRQIA